MALPGRLYIPDDTELIEADLEELTAMFYADGEGLPRADIAEALAPISDLLTVLGLDTGILISNLKQVRFSLLLFAQAGSMAFEWDGNPAHG